MIYDIDVRFNYRMDHPTDVIMQVQVPDMHDQSVVDETIDMSPVMRMQTVPAEANIGARTLLRTFGDLSYSYSAKVDVTRGVQDIAQLDATSLHALPSEAVRCLMPSRYCLPFEVQAVVGSQFDTLSGGALIVAISDWIFETFQYDAGVSDAQTTAVQSAEKRQGVCRDYAHVLISLARSAAIPARFVSAYAPDVTPQDFHAVVEVFLCGAWHLVDPTRMSKADEIVRIGVGMDAAEVAFLTSFGPMTFETQSVQVKRGTTHHRPVHAQLGIA